MKSQFFISPSIETVVEESADILKCSGDKTRCHPQENMYGFPVQRVMSQYRAKSILCLNKAQDGTMFVLSKKEIDEMD